MSNKGPMPVAAMHYAMAIRAKRDILATLFYAIRNNAADSWALHQQLARLKPPFVDAPSIAAAGAGAAPHAEVQDAKRTAEATAQDSALALMLIIDYSLRRFRESTEPKIDTWLIGADIFDGVKLNAAIWALANQARHFHEWQDCSDDKLEAKKEARILRSLEQDPLNLNAAREVVCALNAPSYINFEEMLLATVEDVLSGSWFTAKRITPSSIGMDIRAPKPQ